MGKKKKIIGVLLAIIVVIIGLILLLMRFRKHSDSEPIFYVTEKKLMYKESVYSNKAYVIKENVVNGYAATKNIFWDNKYGLIYFIDYSANEDENGILYCISLKDVLKGNIGAVRVVDTNVAEYTTASAYNSIENFYNNSGVLYYYHNSLKDDWKHPMYRCVNGEKTFIAEDFSYACYFDDKVIMLRNYSEDDYSLTIMTEKDGRFDTYTVADELGIYDICRIEDSFYLGGLQNELYKLYCYQNGELKALDYQIDDMIHLRTVYNDYIEYYDSEQNIKFYEIGTGKTYKFDYDESAGHGSYILDIPYAYALTQYTNDESTYVTIGLSPRKKIGENIKFDKVIVLEDKKELYVLSESKVWKYSFDMTHISEPTLVYDGTGKNISFTKIFGDDGVYIKETNGQDAKILLPTEKKATVIKKVRDDSQIWAVGENVYLYQLANEKAEKYWVLQYDSHKIDMSDFDKINFYQYMGNGKLLVQKDNRLVIINCKNGKEKTLINDVSIANFAYNSKYNY